MASCTFVFLVLLFLVIPPSLCSTPLEEPQHDAINEIIVDLAQYVMENYMTNNQGCVTVVSEGTAKQYFHDYNATSLILVSLESSENEDCDPDFKLKLEPCFVSYCSNYVIRMSKPICFVASWNAANYEFPEMKHNPRMFFLPFLPSTGVNYGEALFDFEGSDDTLDILVADFVENGSSDSKIATDTDDWYVNIYTSNYHEHPGQPKRRGGIIVDRWFPNHSFEGNADLYPNKVQNLRGKELKMFAVDYPPYTNNEPLEGTEVQLMKLFCEMSNCSIISIFDDDEWGHIYPLNRSGTGCSGQVYIGNADVCVGANYAWIQFWPFLDFSTGYFSGELTVIVPKPSALGGWSTPFLPFSAILWTSVFVCTIMSTVGLYWITRATLKYIPSFRRRLIENDKFLTLSDSFIRSLGMLVLQQPQQLVPGSPVRYLFTAMEIVYLVVTTCYAAELYDSLTVPRTHKPIENIHDLADSNIVWMGNADAYLLMINNTDDPKTLKAVNNFKILPDEKISALGESGGYGIVVERLVGGHFVELPYITDKFIELSITMKQAFVQSPLFTYLRKGSPYTKRLNQIIGRMLNGGLMYKWEDDCSAKLLDYSKQQKLLASTRKVTYPPKVLKVDDLEGAFLVYILGIFLSIVLFIVEVYPFKRKPGIPQEANQ